VQASLQAGISFSGVEIFTHLNGLTAGSTAGGAQFAASAAGTIVGIATVAMAIGACVEGFFDLMDASVTKLVDRVMGTNLMRLDNVKQTTPSEIGDSESLDSSEHFQPLTKDILSSYVKNNYCPTCSPGELQNYTGKMFEMAWHRFAYTLPTIGKRNYVPNKEAVDGNYRGEPRTTVPDGMADSVYISTKGEFGVIPQGSYFEVKAKNGDVYASTSNGQIEGHITALKKSHPLAQKGDLFMHIITMANTKISPSITAKAAENGVEIRQWYATYRIDDTGQMVLRFNRVRPYPQRFFDYSDEYDIDVILSY
jgi:hypothetical protein